MGQPIIERRSYNRFGASVVQHMQAVLRPGRVVRLVNLSCGGALIEGRRPFRPGARVFLNLSSEERSAGRAAHVLRCAVAALTGSEGVRYHGALKFDDHWERVWEEFTRTGCGVPDDGGAGELFLEHMLPGLDDPPERSGNGGC
jgi:hypothetical protein